MFWTAGAAAGDAVASGQEGVRYQYGEGVERDYAQAYRLYCSATLQGDGEAAYRLGWMHLNGYGVPKDDALAVGWFQLAAERDDPYSRRLLDDVLMDVMPAEDPACPLRNSQPDRATIEAWVHVLAPGFELDPKLLLAIIEVESRFNPQARSHKNARGLMQLMPGTAERFEVENIMDPFENLMGGMAYLRWLLDHYEQDRDLALAAYNAGEHVVKRYGGIPPYQETRHYVTSINQLYNQAVQSGTALADETAPFVMTATQ
ncbi:MAG: transglycosylase SLT domain-containing protein [Gammaproteobacteria bacterium]